MSVSYGGDKITFDDGTSIASGLSHFRNRVINGAMEIDQRRNGSAATVDGDNVYGVDRWTSTEIGNGAFTQQQISDAPSGFKNSLRITTTTAQTGTLNAVTRHYIEGTNLVDLAWGTASAKTITLSFWVKSSLTGTFGGAIRNDSDAGALRNYVISYTISSANTWEYKTITIPGDTTGTWPTTTGIGLIIWFSHGTGNLGAANSWSGSDHRGVTGQTNLISTLNATWQITGVQFEVGSFATTFERRPYGTELALCQRYFLKTNPDNSSRCGGMWGSMYTSTTGHITGSLPVAMRIAPTATRGGTNDTFYISNVSASSAGAIQNFSSTTITIDFELTGMSTGAIGYPIQYNGQLSLTSEL